MTKKVFFTGGSGFVGQNMIPQLIQNGYEVYALARSDASLKKVEALGAIGVRGDLTEPESIGTALQACDIVIHSAAYIDFFTFFEYEKFYRINVQATKDLLHAAREYGVKKFIYIGAALVVSGGVVQNVDESFQPEGLPSDHYLRTKAMAENAVVAANGTEFETVVLRPPAIWGPNNNHHYDTIFSAVKEGQWIWIGKGEHTLSTIHVDNLSAAVLAAIKNGQAGEIYFVTDGERRPIKNMFTSVFKAQGFDPGNRSIPRPIAFVMAHSVAAICKFFRIKKRMPIAPVLIDILGTEFSVSDQKARDEIGYRNVLTIDEGLERLADGKV